MKKKMPKTDQTQTADGGQIIDVKRAADVVPSTTSKPVIVSNRPTLDADPMIAKAAAAAAEFKDHKTPAPTAEHDVQADEMTEKPVPAGAPLIQKHSGTMAANPSSEKLSLPGQTAASSGGVATASEKEPSVSQNNANTDAAKTGDTPPDNTSKDDKTGEKPNDKSQQDGTSATTEAIAADAIDSDDATKKTVDKKPAEVDKETDDPDAHIKISHLSSKKKIMPLSSADKLASAETKEADTATSDETIEPEKPIESPDEQMNAENIETAEETAEQKRIRDLESIIASGKYYLPLDGQRRRRERITLAVLFVVLLLLFLLDAMLDMGMVSLPGVPHTTFFSGH